jgi:hypothetical protein
VREGTCSTAAAMTPWFDGLPFEPATIDEIDQVLTDRP